LELFHVDLLRMRLKPHFDAMRCSVLCSIMGTNCACGASRLPIVLVISFRE
uniref:Ovule protein n=1 Tax=Hymenolepis diminuta TaxID=6216 RepID=A0A0R3SL72_HYMDI